MKKSASLSAYKLDFNLKQCKIGQSNIDKLPLKPDSRRYSASHLPRPLLIQQKSQIEQLKTINILLKKQNDKLKRQLQVYQRQSVSTATKFNTQVKVSEYRDKIRSKMSSKVKTSRETECDEALMTTKQVSIEQISVTISDWYDQYNLAKKLPTLYDLRDVADRFFKDYCSKYAKLKSLFECLQSSKQQEEYKKLSDLIEIYKVPLLYQKSPQTLLRELSKSKDKTRIKTVQKQVCWEILSPNQTLSRFEGLLSKLCRSGQMLKALRGNQQVMKLINKLGEKN